MQTVLFNRFTPSGARRESLNGRDYLVVPMTLIVPGVLSGSKGPLLYPPDEVAREPAVWNHMPIVVYHPEQDGIPVSARSPSIVARSKVGEVYNSYIDENGKLKAEGWFDIEATQRVDNRVLSSLQHNRPIELSTGLYTDNQPVGIGEVAAYPTYNGKEYHFIARNYRPDHLAILPDQKGACSLSDGCGVLINMEMEADGDEPCCDSCKEGKPCDKCNHDDEDELITDNVRESFLTWLGRTIGVLNYDPDQARDENGRWVKGWKKKQRQAQAEAAAKAEAAKTEPTKSEAPADKQPAEPTKHYHKTVVKIVNPPAVPLPPAPASVGSKVDEKILSSLADDIKTLTRDGQNLRVALAGLSEKVSMLSMMSLQSQMASLQSKVGGFSLSEADQSLIKKITDHILTMGKDTSPVKDEKSEPAKPTKTKRPVEDRLKQIRDREQAKGTPYIDMVMYVLKQDRGSHSPAVPQNVTYTQLFKDLQRQARGEKPLHVDVPRKELASALKAVSHDFGKLSTKELYRLLPHMTYTDQDTPGVTGTDAIRQRHIPQSAVDKVIKTPTTNECPHIDDLSARVKARLVDDRRLLILLVMQLFNDCDGDAEELACSFKWLSSQMPDSRPTGNQLLLNMLYGTPLPLNRATEGCTV